MTRLNPLKSANGRFISTPKQLFDKHVVASEGCWEWGGYRNKWGYGFTRVGGRGSKGILAHRLSWSLRYGDIPTGMHVLHKCDNPCCVNPAHLFLGTNQDNINDRVAKGRSSHWVRFVARNSHPNTKILDFQILEMAERKIRGEKVKDIAAAYGVTKDHASKVISRHLKGERFGVPRD